MGAVHEFETHLISRATFGWRPEVERDVLDAGWEAWLARQLDPSSIPDPQVDRLLADYRTLENSNWQNHQFLDTSDDAYYVLLGERAHATLLRAVFSRRQLFEVMVEFWTNHFNISLDEAEGEHLITVDNREVVRAHALGRFADLLRASAHSPAMLVYLDNWVSNANSAEGVNENYGRELLELHTLGIIDGVEPYTEADMRGVALVMSGWSVSFAATRHTFLFRDAYHHHGPVSILGGAFSTPGRSGTAALPDGDDLLDVLAHHPATARHLAHKLCRRFVRDDPPPALVASAAQVYLDNDTAIAPVLSHLFHSAEFAASRGAKVRRGFEVLTAYARALRGTVDPDPIGDLSARVHSIGWGILDSLGQRLWGHQTPDGYPDTGPDWISADSLLQRWGTAGAVTADWMDGWTYDTEAILRPRGPSVNTWIEGVARRLLGVVTGYPTHGFRDVPAWVEDSVRWITAKGYAAGWPDGTFRPNADISRGQVTNMLWKIAGSPTGHPAHGLSDVPAWLEPAVRWAKATGIVPPMTARRYRPNVNMPRTQVVGAAWRMAGSPTHFPDHGLSDVPAAINQAVRWAVTCDHMAGFPNGTFRPNAAITRAQVTRMLHRIHDDTPALLTAAERAACLELFADTDVGPTEPVPGWLLEWKAHDLTTLVLSLPRFQRR
jgi:uncharacterized protein (DUF1800 family)